MSWIWLDAWIFLRAVGLGGCGFFLLMCCGVSRRGRRW